MAYEPEPEAADDEEQEAPDIHTLKKNFELLHTNNPSSSAAVANQPKPPANPSQRVDERPKLSGKQLEERKKAEEEKRRRDLRCVYSFCAFNR